MLDVQAMSPAGLRPLTRSEYELLVDNGLLHDEPVELLEGCLVRMSPQRPRHAAVIDRLNQLLMAAVGIPGLGRVRIQLPLALSDVSVPEPDVAIVPPGNYDDAHPETAWLVVEVAESSLALDLGAKARIYAAAGVPEYWVVNLPKTLIEVFREPEDDRYMAHAAHRDGAIALASLPDIRVAVGDVLHG